MNNYGFAILDACTIINILHIDDEDDFLFKQIQQFKIRLPEIILKEANINWRKKRVDDSKEHQIDQNISLLYACYENLDEYEKDGTIDKIKEFSRHTKKENGELYATALALKISRDENVRVYFYTDDFPAKEEFGGYFDYQQIGQIQDSVDLLVFLYRMNTPQVFSKHMLQQYLSLLSAEYNVLCKRIVGAAEGYKQKHSSPKERKGDKELYYAIEKVISGFYSVDPVLFKKGIDFFKTHKGKNKEIDEIISEYTSDSIWDIEICEKIKGVLTYMSKYDIVQAY